MRVLLHRNIVFAFMASILILFVQTTKAQTKKSRLLFLVDASSSMSLKWHADDTRFDAARKVILSIMDSMYAINNEVEFAVRVYGSQSVAQDKNCYDTKLEVDFSLQNLNQINTRMKHIAPIGSSPIAFSLGEASRNELSNTTKYDYSFVLITDGGESCGGDICDAYKKLVANNVKVTPYVIGLDTNTMLLRYYECLGKYVSVTQPDQIAKAVSLILENNRALLDKKKVLGITTTYSEGTKLEQPAFAGQESNLQYLTPISPIKLMTAAIRVPRATNLVFRKTPKIDALYIPDPKPAIDGIVNLNSVNARRMAFEFKRPLPNKKWDLKSVTIPPVINDRNAINMSNLASNMVHTRAIKLPTLPKGKTRTMPKMPQLNLVFEKEPITISQIVNPTTLLPMKALVLKASPSGKARKQAKTLFPILVFEKPEIKIVSLEQSKFIKYTLSILEKNKPTKKMGPYAKIIIEPDPMDSVKIAAIWSNQFRLSYTPSKPKPKYKVAPPMRKMYIPVYAAKVPEKPKVIEPEFTTKTEESNETKIQVYFTDGKGKFYKTKPDVQIVDPNNGNVKKTFIRTVSAGEPDPIKLDFDGTFDVTVVGQKDITLHNVAIPKNKTTKIYLKVENGTLVFTYRDNRNRPVEFKAKIFVRNKGTNDYVQVVCTEQKMFEPGDYYIEVDVLPPYGLVTEISFGATTEIQLPQLGAVQFTNTENLGVVNLYVEKVDHFEPFHTTNVSGDASTQKVMLRPGVYQASFVRAGLPPNSPPTLTKFIVRSNTITNVELENIGNKVISPDGTGNLIYTKETPKINFQVEGQKK